MFSRNQKSREWHDRFARYRENHTLHDHSEEYGDISGLLNKCSDVGREEFGNSHRNVEMFKSGNVEMSQLITNSWIGSTSDNNKVPIWL